MLTLASLAGVVAALYPCQGRSDSLDAGRTAELPADSRVRLAGAAKLGRVPAVLVTAALAFTLVGAGAWAITVQMIDLAPKIPEYQKNIQTKLLSVNDYFSTALKSVRKKAGDIGQRVPPSEAAGNLEEREEPPGRFAWSFRHRAPLKLLGSSVGFRRPFVVMGSTGIVIVLVVFFPDAARGFARSLHSPEWEKAT